VNVIVTTGHPESNYLEIHEILIASGLLPAQPTQHEALSPLDVQQILLKAQNTIQAKETTDNHVDAVKVSHGLAVELFKVNVTKRIWGWADPEAVWLLDFWKEFDANIQFVLVYSAPESTIAKKLLNTEATPTHIAQAMTLWRNHNTEILRFYNRNPKRCVLVNSAAASRRPDLLLERVTEAFTGTELRLPEWTSVLSEAQFVANALVKSLICGYHREAALYQEMQSSADLGDDLGISDDEEMAKAWREYVALLDKLKCAVEERREQHRRATRLQAETTRLKSQVEELRRQLGNTKTESDATPLRPVQSQPPVLHITRENEILRLQTQQLQEELEYSLGKLDALESECRMERHRRALQGAFVRQQVKSVLIDMRQEIDGDNWYDSEQDGRWAGPSERSVLRMPPLREGRYKGQLDVTGWMEPAILDGMKLWINGLALEINIRSDKNRTIVLFGFTTQDINALPVWEFHFKFPKLVSPANLGSEDQRILAVKLQFIHLEMTP